MKILKIDQEIGLDNLKNLKNLRLVELKIRLIETKRNIINVIGSFYKEANPIKYFADGNSNKTLKKLDLANSQIKFKTIRPLLWMNELEELILDDCEKIGH